ncbi:SMI1/KNR4 family protein [Achromobacter marplatensis]|uniref:SMI1/KNR4 family protein n=1 Tax=Achromobacter marplatensis TaxID=470868 RepID=A0AA42WGE9_9BURK|nr:SMI1/KNR4 family protein [Achromobacter marplatensis]MDH2054985.1 SMI1/KNR4 family protein [Achromobacter marplatensis]
MDSGYVYRYLLRDWCLEPGASADEIGDVVKRMRFSLPADYLNFIGEHNGGEGFVGENYLILWKIGDLIDFNADYEVENYAPGIFLFGSSGGGEGYGFDTRSLKLPIVRIPFIGMELQYADKVSDDFGKLWSALRESR